MKSQQERLNAVQKSMQPHSPLTRFSKREQACISIPVLVLGAGVVQVLCRNDKRCEENSMTSTVHALCDFRKTTLQALEVDEGAEQGRYLNI